MWSYADSVKLPDWSCDLANMYWHIRCCGRNAAVRRRYYRMVEAEKLRLAELGVCQIKIAAVCRYLSNFKNFNTLRRVLSEPEIQLSFSFYYLT